MFKLSATRKQCRDMPNWLRNVAKISPKGYAWPVGDLIAAAHVIEAQNNMLDECEAMIARYRGETPLGNQPHMIAHKADELLAKLRGDAQ